VTEPAIGSAGAKLVRRLRSRRYFPAVLSPGAQAARANALLAVEHDPVRRHERLGGLRLAAAVLLAGRVEVCEALLAGVPVPASRLCSELVRGLGLEGDVVLDESLSLRVLARGPLNGKEVAL
jgi:hypothetical protein